MAVQLPTVVDDNGLVPQAPQAIWQQILAGAAAYSPGYTANLPGTLIEDVSSTDTAAVVQMDSARVETVDSVTPYGCNAWLLTILGQVYGVDQGQATNTSVDVIFSGNPGFVIPPGFTVSDGVYQYLVQDGGSIGSTGQSAPLSCLAAQSGIWAVPVGTVTQLITSVPSAYTITCVNPTAGLPGTGKQTESDYRVQVLQAGLAAGIGFPSAIKTALQNVSGVQPRLISVQQQPGGQWKIIVGGGDAYAVAYAILNSTVNIASLVLSSLVVTNITNAANAIVTTNLNHNYVNGQIVYVSGVMGMTAINGLPMTVTVIDATHFYTAVTTSLFGAYSGGGVLSPNNRNNTVSLLNYPDAYAVNFISPPQQLVTITVTWNTTLTGFINQSAVAQLGAPAIASYINNIAVGQPINVFDLQTAFQTAIISVLAPQWLTRMLFSVNINGVGVLPSTGTGVISGDPESYFYTDPLGANITIVQG